MTKVKKSLADKEQELKMIISDAKKKLSRLQDKQKVELGELACKHGLNEFDLSVLEKAFKQLYTELKS